MSLAVTLLVEIGPGAEVRCHVCGAVDPTDPKNRDGRRGRLSGTLRRSDGDPHATAAYYDADLSTIPNVDSFAKATTAGEFLTAGLGGGERIHHDL